jgi:4-alpha-glucanotransferase
MKLTFFLRYYTHPGQNLYLINHTDTSAPSVGSDRLLMSYFNSEYWSLTFDTDFSGSFSYSYQLELADGEIVLDGEHPRTLEAPKKGVSEIQIFDSWNNEGNVENVFYTAPFKKVFLSQAALKAKPKLPKAYSHIFKVKAPFLKKNEVLFLTGSGPALGEWHQKDAISMTREGDWWTARVEIPQENIPLQYKYGVSDTKGETTLPLETGENRLLHGSGLHNSLTIIHDGFARLPGQTWKGAGVAIPVFSLRSKNSFGVGEFEDLKPLADWAKETGLKIIQILPINDTIATYTFADSYPYAAISAYALHPIYINLEAVAGKKHSALLKPLKKKQKELNDLTVVDYVEVLKTKLETLRQLFEASREEYLENTDFYAFFTENKHWLAPYAAFSYLRDKFGTADSSQWKTNREYSKESIDRFVSPKAKHYNEIFFHYFVQYHLHLQLKSASDYAHKKGLVVKGDIPIGIYRYSCDAWVAPELYNMNMQAGAPPDDFAVKGQNWGFPTYNWQRMQEDGFDWWKKRFEQMSTYFDAFRIDHILGFFRIWSVPLHAVEGIMGYFVPAIPVHINEFGERGIWFDRDRYTKPFITAEVLSQIFGERADEVRIQYFSENEGAITLKPEFDTQQKVAAHLGDTDDAVKIGLYDVISNVILFEVPESDGTAFHFRITMEKTSSFQSLEWNTQQQLKALYVDYFYRRQEYNWRKEALNKLPALKAATNMLICGEDLGMVPHCVPEVMKNLGILSLEIQRMPKDINRKFFHPNDAPFLSVVTPSTHDMSTIRGWWEEDRQATQQFFNLELGQWGEAPETCEDWINKAIVLQHLYSPAMWSIFQLQDLFGMDAKIRRANPEDERINVPAIAKHYWRYRMHIPLEQLMKEKAFNSALKNYVQTSQR